MKKPTILLILGLAALINTSFADDTTNTLPVPPPDVRSQSEKDHNKLIPNPARNAARMAIRRDMNVFVNACLHSSGDANEQLRCFKQIDTLIAGDNLELAISKACGNMAYDASTIGCFKTASQLMSLMGFATIAQATKGCIEADATVPENVKALCYKQAFTGKENLPKRSTAYVLGLETVKVACDNLKNPESETACFSSALKTLISKPNLYEMLFKMCDAKGMQTDDESAACFINGINEITARLKKLSLDPTKKVPYSEPNEYTDILDSCGPKSIALAKDERPCFRARFEALTKDLDLYVKKTSPKAAEQISERESARKPNAVKRSL